MAGGAVERWSLSEDHRVRAVRAGSPGFFDNSFTNNGDGTITDTSTGLMWQNATASGTYSWREALAYCENLTWAGHSDWRLPNRNELQSLINYDIYFPEPFHPESIHWTSSPVAGFPQAAWGIVFSSGGTDYFLVNEAHRVLAVRSTSQAVPTLSEWGMIILGLMLLGASLVRMRRQKTM